MLGRWESWRMWEELIVVSDALKVGRGEDQGDVVVGVVVVAAVPVAVVGGVGRRGR